jgi:hypothetical protein
LLSFTSFRGAGSVFLYLKLKWNQNVHWYLDLLILIQGVQMGLTATQSKSLFMVESPFSIVVHFLDVLFYLPFSWEGFFFVEKKNLRFFPIVEAFDDSLINEFVVNNWVTFRLTVSSIPCHGFSEEESSVSPICICHHCS